MGLTDTQVRWIIILLVISPMIIALLQILSSSN